VDERGKELDSLFSTNTHELSANLPQNTCLRALLRHIHDAGLPKRIRGIDGVWNRFSSKPASLDSLQDLIQLGSGYGEAFRDAPPFSATLRRIKVGRPNNDAIFPFHKCTQFLASFPRLNGYGCASALCIGLEMKRAL
jgi:hypothetical protein